MAIFENKVNTFNKLPSFNGLKWVIVGGVILVVVLPLLNPFVVTPGVRLVVASKN
jgi:hypothetical protein